MLKNTPCLRAFANPSHLLLLNATWRLTFPSYELTPPLSDPLSNVL